VVKKAKESKKILFGRLFFFLSLPHLRRYLHVLTFLFGCWRCRSSSRIFLCVFTIVVFIHVYACICEYVFVCVGVDHVSCGRCPPFLRLCLLTVARCSIAADGRARRTADASLNIHSFLLFWFLLLAARGFLFFISRVFFRACLLDGNFFHSTCCSMKELAAPLPSPHLTGSPRRCV
jgi:hypothetical protein